MDGARKQLEKLATRSFYAVAAVGFVCGVGFGVLLAARWWYP